MMITDWQQQKCFASGKFTGLEALSSLDLNIEKKQRVVTGKENPVIQTQGLSSAQSNENPELKAHPD